jgi:nucleoside-diphosphate-sugar epimerase
MKILLIGGSGFIGRNRDIWLVHNTNADLRLNTKD